MDHAGEFGLTSTLPVQVTFQYEVTIVPMIIGVVNHTLGGIIDAIELALLDELILTIVPHCSNTGTESNITGISSRPVDLFTGGKYCSLHMFFSSLLISIHH